MRSLSQTLIEAVLLLVSASMMVLYIPTQLHPPTCTSHLRIIESSHHHMKQHQLNIRFCCFFSMCLLLPQRSRGCCGEAACIPPAAGSYFVYLSVSRAHSMSVLYILYTNTGYHTQHRNSLTLNQATFQLQKGEKRRSARTTGKRSLQQYMILRSTIVISMEPWLHIITPEAHSTTEGSLLPRSLSWRWCAEQWCNRSKRRSKLKHINR